MTEYRTVSIPKPLADDVVKLIEEVGYWPSLTSFVREACHEKLYVVPSVKQTCGKQWTRSRPLSPLPMMKEPYW